MPIPTAKLAQKKAKLRSKKDGTTIVLKYTEWPNGKPDPDPTTGAWLTGSDTTKIGVTHSASVRAFVHFIEPITSGYRKFAEITAGDAIVDFPLSLIRITEVGDTAFTVGQIVDEVAFGAANRAVTNSALGDDVDPQADLENVSMVFANHTWVQKEVGEELARNWDTLYSGININRAMLMTTTA